MCLKRRKKLKRGRCWPIFKINLLVLKFFTFGWCGSRITFCYSTRLTDSILVVDRDLDEEERKKERKRGERERELSISYRWAGGDVSKRYGQKREIQNAIPSTHREALSIGASSSSIFLSIGGSTRSIVHRPVCSLFSSASNCLRTKSQCHTFLFQHSVPMLLWNK